MAFIKKWIIRSTALIILLVIGFSTAYYLSAQSISLEVTEKASKIRPGDTAETYLVWGLVDGSKEVESFEVTDTWTFLRFDSADEWGKIQKGALYNAEVVGWRVPFFSTNRNILNTEKFTTTLGTK